MNDLMWIQSRLSGRMRENMKKQIEFDNIRELWKSYAVTDRTREKMNEAAFPLSEKELKKFLRDAADSKKMIEKLGLPPLRNTAEIKKIIANVKEGNSLTPRQLECVENVLATVRLLKDYLRWGKLYDNPLALCGERLDALEELREEICRQIKDGRIDDYASMELLRIRKIMKVCGRKPEKQRELQLCKNDEREETDRILRELTDMVAESEETIYTNISVIEELDLLFTKGRLSIAVSCS